MENNISNGHYENIDDIYGKYDNSIEKYVKITEKLKFTFFCSRIHENLSDLAKLKGFYWQDFNASKMQLFINYENFWAMDKSRIYFLLFKILKI